MRSAPRLLAIQHVVYFLSDLLRSKEIDGAAVPRPHARAVFDERGLYESARRPGLERVEHALRSLIRGDDSVHMVGSDVEREQSPGSVLADVTNRLRHNLAHRVIKLNRRVPQLRRFPGVEALACREKRRTESIVATIDRAARIAVKPRAVRAPTDELCERRVVHTTSLQTAMEAGSPSVSEGVGLDKQPKRERGRGFEQAAQA